MLVRLIPRKYVCDCSDFHSSRIVRTDLSLFPWQLFDQRVGNSLNRAADVGSPYFKNLSRLATTYRIPLAYLHNVFQYAINEEELPKRRSFARNQQFKVGNFAFGTHKSGRDFPIRFKI